jgi:hypothetical protein
LIGINFILSRVLVNIALPQAVELFVPVIMFEDYAPT